MFAWSKYVTCRRVLVSLTGDEGAIRGILFKQDGDLLIIKNAEFLSRNEAPAKLEGDVIVERINVLFLQTLPGG